MTYSLIRYQIEIRYRNLKEALIYEKEKDFEKILVDLCFTDSDAFTLENGEKGTLLEKTSLEIFYEKGHTGGFFGIEAHVVETYNESDDLIGTDYKDGILSDYWIKWLKEILCLPEFE